MTYYPLAPIYQQVSQMNKLFLAKEYLNAKKNHRQDPPAVGPKVEIIKTAHPLDYPSFGRDGYDVYLLSDPRN